MSKDKGSKNVKKVPTAKTAPKTVSSYKAENASKYPTIDDVISKMELKKTPKKR